MHNAFGLGPSGRATPFQANHDRKPLFSRPEDHAENPLHLYSTARTPGYGRIGMGGDSHATGLRKPRPVSEAFASTARDQANANANANGNANSNANASVLSSGGTKIPRLNSLSQSRRKPISLRKAMELAEGEEEAAKMMLEAGMDDPATMCSLYCRPSTCPASKAPCVWSLDDPTEFGTALPIKLDQWITGGSGRQLASVVYEEAHDLFADIQDLALRRSITDVNVEVLSPEQKRRHRRRLRKKGLVASPKAPRPEDKAKWDEWRAARLAKERASQKQKDKGSTAVEEEMPKPIPVVEGEEEGEQGWVKIKGWR
ncbi:hypothetical protein M440DRAFT_1389063 [Trichoderma longibrachiatum ATCC 18648]|uniref:Uncharacterized protein n=1 Tax=Trichoderma longibrachiatum ATCC 18648 TaxID=983965 RepID=A0A2T4CBR2_TRILO|nr:hypothetical protein M440DRAFT_1389063 [Trichoderma longibrachiatum ATCC 18648]